MTTGLLPARRPDQRTGRTPNVLVTLTDANWVEAAKQLFAGAYYRAGWRGDYLLLAHAVPEPELEWFEERGILVYRCRPLFGQDMGGMPPVLTSKFHLFTPPFRRWRRVIYMDADCLVRASIDPLAELEGFHSVLDWNPVLKLQTSTPRMLRCRGADLSEQRRLLRRQEAYSPDAPAFCAGFFVLDTGLIVDSTCAELVASMQKLRYMSRFGDQLVLNLHFRHTWSCLSPIYNLILHHGRPPWPLAASDTDAIIVHCAGPDKPWVSGAPFNDEWHCMFSMADRMNLDDIPEGETWSEARMNTRTRHLRRRLAVSNIARLWLAPLSR